MSFGNVKVPGMTYGIDGAVMYADAEAACRNEDDMDGWPNV